MRQNSYITMHFNTGFVTHNLAGRVPRCSVLKVNFLNVRFRFISCRYLSLITTTEDEFIPFVLFCFWLFHFCFIDDFFLSAATDVLLSIKLFCFICLFCFCDEILSGRNRVFFTLSRHQRFRVKARMISRM